MKSKIETFGFLVLLLAFVVSYAQKEQTSTNPSGGKAASDSQPKPVHKTFPMYPPEAKAKGISGGVVVEAVVDKLGNVIYAKFIAGDNIFSDAALAAIKDWKFQPATSQGQPVQKTVQIRFDFCDKGVGKGCGR